MFLAIINDTYAEVKTEIEATFNAYEMGDYFRRGYNNVRADVYGVRDRTIDMENALKLANADGQCTFEEIRGSLKK